MAVPANKQTQTVAELVYLKAIRIPRVVVIINPMAINRTK